MKYIAYISWISTVSPVEDPISLLNMPTASGAPRLELICVRKKSRMDAEGEETHKSRGKKTRWMQRGKRPKMLDRKGKIHKSRGNQLKKSKARRGTQRI